MKCYVQAADRLRERILAGEFGKTGRLPPERGLCRQLGVSRITVRQALGLLAEERLLVRRQGSGTYVSSRPARRIPLRIDYTDSMREHAPRLRRRLLEWNPAAQAGEMAGELGGVGKDDALWALRLDFLGEVPVALDRVWIAKRFARHLCEVDLERVDFVEIWARKENFRIHSCRQLVEAVAAPGDVARHLRVKSGQPLLKTLEVYEDHQAVALGAFVSFYHPSLITLSARYDWGISG
ncbi:MAG: GntR family transcriptional regulator [Verrucomicrobiae bacterium]|nr:GntR family transcriptional regulator [Verrucomicrobiae bacterium]